MGFLNFIIAIIALIIAIIAFQRTGGTKDLKKSTAELLARVEKKMREEDRKVKEDKVMTADAAVAEDFKKKNSPDSIMPQEKGY